MQHREMENCSLRPYKQGFRPSLPPLVVALGTTNTCMEMKLNNIMVLLDFSRDQGTKPVLLLLQVQIFSLRKTLFGHMTNADNGTNITSLIL